MSKIDDICFNREKCLGLRCMHIWDKLAIWLHDYVVKDKVNVIGFNEKFKCLCEMQDTATQRLERQKIITDIATFSQHTYEVSEEMWDHNLFNLKTWFLEKMMHEIDCKDELQIFVDLDIEAHGRVVLTSRPDAFRPDALAAFMQGYYTTYDVRTIDVYEIDQRIMMKALSKAIEEVDFGDRTFFMKGTISI